MPAMINYTKMITVQRVYKNFGVHEVLRDISFSIKTGEVVGFLGPNGAGKTTLMRVLTSYLQPTQGRVVIGGYDVAKNSIATRKYIGYLPETPPLYPNMTVRDYLKFAAELKGVNRKHLSQHIDMALAACDLNDVQRDTIGILSKGYRQRIGIAQAIIHDPQVIILDEPTSGLDPMQIRQVRKLIKNLEPQKTILLSTHILSEIEQIAKRVIIIKSGQIALDQDLVSMLKTSDDNQKITLEEIFLNLTS